jgi:glucose/arabinose dehydrogenase
MCRRLSARRVRNTALIALLLTATACGGEQGSSVSTDDGLVSIGAGLRGPSGLIASVYATGLTHAAAFAFDSDGRQWVATADATDQGTDGVYLVSASGAAAKVITDVHTPLGLLWYQGALYVASTGRVDVYSGFDGTAFTGDATIVTLPDGVGEVNGIALGPDGRISMGISAPCDHCTPTSPWSAAVVSFLPDGRDLRVDARGIRAAVGLAYLPGTNDLFVTMNQRDDLGSLTPGDWLSVVVAGQAWGFPNCYGQGGGACAGAPAPIAELDKHAAVSGVAIVTGQLGTSVGTSAVVAEWTTGKIQQVALIKAGSTYTGSVRPFLTGLQNPEPVSVGPDGALFAGDWQSGTIYRVATTTDG